MTVGSSKSRRWESIVELSKHEHPYRAFLRFPLEPRSPTFVGAQSPLLHDPTLRSPQLARRHGHDMHNNLGHINTLHIGKWEVGTLTYSFLDRASIHFDILSNLIVGGSTTRNTSTANYGLGYGSDKMKTAGNGFRHMFLFWFCQ